MTRDEIECQYPTPTVAWHHIERSRWPDGPRCVYCGAATVSRHQEVNRAPRLQCSHCRRSFSVATGTALHHSHVDPRAWLHLMAILAEQPAIGAVEASRLIEVRRQTVAVMLRRLRHHPTRL